MVVSWKDGKKVFGNYKKLIAWELINDDSPILNSAYLMKNTDKKHYDSKDKKIEFLKELEDDEQCQLLWKHKDICEEIAPIIIRQFNKLETKSANIQVNVTFSLSPFFRKKIEKNFFEINNSNEWRSYVGFDPNPNFAPNDNLKSNMTSSDLFAYDTEEREIEKDGYDTEMFRGLAFSQHFTPFYRLINKANRTDQETGETIKYDTKTWEDILEDDLVNLKGMPDKWKRGRKEFLIWLIDKIKNKIKKWDIKIKLTKSGLAVVVFKEIIDTSKIHSDSYYKDIVKDLTASPITEYIAMGKANREFEKVLSIDRLERWEQIFTSYLYAVSIWVISLFLKDRKVYQKVGKILNLEINSGKEGLKYPWGVVYTSDDSFTFLTPPLRNYFYVFYFDMIQGVQWGVEKKITLDCNLDVDTFNEDYNYVSKDKFLKLFANNFLSLVTNSSVSNSNRIPSFSKKYIASLPDKDLSKFSCSICLVESEGIVLCNPSHLEINLGGQKISYGKYWENVIKGFALLSGCKTLLQVIGRNLLECGWDHSFDTKKSLNEITRKLEVASNGLIRSRKILTPSQISRLSYVREKFVYFKQAIGLEELIDSVSKDYDELNSAINVHIQKQRTESLRNLTILLLALSIVMATSGGDVLKTHLSGDAYEKVSSLLLYLTVFGWVAFFLIMFWVVFDHCDIRCRWICFKNRWLKG